MPSYAYCWADGTVTVCNAKNKGEAALKFDEIAPISRRLIIRIQAPIVVTLRPDIDFGWKLDDEENSIDGTFDLELQQKCFPNYNHFYHKVMTMLDEKQESLDQHPELRRKLAKALQRDQDETRQRIKETPETPEIVLFFPEGFPGQNN